MSNQTAPKVAVPARPTAPIGSYAIARGYIFTSPYSTSIEICLPSACDEYVYKPAENVQVYGITAIRELRDFCDKVLAEFEAYNSIVPPPTTPTPAPTCPSIN